MDDGSEAASNSLVLTESLELQLETAWCSPPSFSCAQGSREGGRGWSAEAYLATGSLKRLMLRLDPLPTHFEEDTVELFDIQWVTETALVNSPSHLFFLFRQQVKKLETLLQANPDFGQASNIHCEANAIRQQCVTFLHYVKVFIFRYLQIHKVDSDGPLHPYEELETQLPSILVEELHGLILYVGHLSELPSVTLGAFTIQNQAQLFPASWHLVHLHLDIYWLVLEILHILGEKTLRQVVYAHQFMNFSGENLTNVSLFEEHCASLICDLISLSVNKYNKVRPAEALVNHHCLCPCVKELWVLLIQLLDHRSKGTLTESFWSWMNKLLKNLFKRPSDTEGFSDLVLTQCKDPLGFSWWIITHLASLYQFDRIGVLEEKKQMESNWSFVEELLKKSCNPEASILEEQLRMHLNCCLMLCDFWNTNIPTVTILWEYYSKNLNSSFNIPWLGLKGYVNISKSPLSMLEMVKACCTDHPRSDLHESRNSYTVFLCVLAKMVKKAMGTSGIHPWKQIKGRIYSKFHRKRMEELTEVGLQNFFSLFLVLASVAEIEDVASRALDLLTFLRPASVTPSQRALIWKGHLVFLLMYVERNLDVGVLSEKLAKDFCERAKSFLVSKSDVEQKRSLWRLLAVYVDGVQEVFETSCFLHLSQEKLLNEGFSMLLPACREAELSVVLNFLQAVLARLRSVHAQSRQEHPAGMAGGKAPISFTVKEHHLAVADALWKNFFPFLKSQRLSQTASLPLLADTAAGFTLLALDMPSTAPSDLQPQPVWSMLQLFGWDDMIWPQLVSRYLSHLIQNRTLTEEFSHSGCSSFEALSVRSWFRCVLQMYCSKPTALLDSTDAELAVGKEYMEQLTELTRLIFQLSEVKSLLSKTQDELSSVSQDPQRALVLFLEAVGVTYSSLQTLPEKSAMVLKSLDYLGEVLKYVKPYLMRKGPSKGLKLTYRTMGILVKSWALILSTSKAQKLLFQIIDCLLLPHAVLQQEKELPTAMLAAIQDSLPLYLQGMCIICSQSQTQNTYLHQLLGNVVRQYIGRFLPASPSVSGLGLHPVLSALGNSTATPSISALRRTIVQVIKENYLQFKGSSPPPRLASVLAFTLELLWKTGVERNDVEFLLPSVLKCLVLVNESQVKKLATEILHSVVETSHVRSGGEPAPQMTSVFRQFIRDYAMIHEQQVYSILEAVAVLDQQLVVGLISTITQTLKDSEHKQGLGKNIAQRNTYYKLLSFLGEPGQDERRKLESETVPLTGLENLSRE
ncbi:protein MMS22-like isoform X1 [Tachyglossus aculeatus]|uniref:protein MMS22-like isoform X1 n=2 Tax=Tachyglossus aculeatus TaxID=9261 RepID=UPI0018F40DB5|nr:protein MMS22-like isoform X1 [Tachyglossus aculeatus]